MLETFLILTDGQNDFFDILRQFESSFVDSQICKNIWVYGNPTGMKKKADIIEKLI